MRKKEILEHANIIKDFCKSRQNCTCCIFYDDEAEHMTRICRLTATLSPANWDFNEIKPEICDYCVHENDINTPCYDCPAELRKDLENE